MHNYELKLNCTEAILKTLKSHSFKINREGERSTLRSKEIDKKGRRTEGKSGGITQDGVQSEIKEEGEELLLQRSVDLPSSDFTSVST